MKSNSANGGFARFMAGRGFYAALALCLVGAAAAAWITVDKSISSASERNESVPVEQSAREEYIPGSAFDVKDAGAPKRGTPVEESAPSSQSSSAETFNFIKKEQKFSLPVEGNVIRGHSGGELVKYDSLNEWRTHDGIDIEAAAGAEIKAAAAGKVKTVKNDPLWGWTVELEHDGGFLTVYCGLNEPSLKEGDEAAAGSVIGTLGDSNLAEISDPSHLHFAMKKDGKFIDPAEKLGIS